MTEEAFERRLYRLRVLRRWKELAIRPSCEDDCPDEDLDLWFRCSCAEEEGNSDCHDDDNGGTAISVREELKELKRRCREARTDLNNHLPRQSEEDAPPVERYLVPRPSAIPDAGLGLFYEPPPSDAAASLPSPKAPGTDNKNIIAEGKVLCYYSGHIHNFQSSNLLRDKRYLLWVGRNWDDDRHGAQQDEDVFVDPGPLPHVKARYANDPLNDDLVNARFVPEPGEFRAAVVASRPIRPGEEIFCPYGDSYWSTMSDCSDVVARRLPSKEEGCSLEFHQ